MAISTNGKSNPSKVYYNGKTVKEVWYKSSPTATPVFVWPEKYYIVNILSNKNAAVTSSRPDGMQFFEDGYGLPKFVQTISRTDTDMINKYRINDLFDVASYPNCVIRVYEVSPGSSFTIAKDLKSNYSGSFKAATTWSPNSNAAFAPWWPDKPQYTIVIPTSPTVKQPTTQYNILYIN